MDYAQKRLDYEQTDRLSTLTEEEKRKLAERRDQGLQRLIERADAVLAEDKKLLKKRELERLPARTADQKQKFRERKALEVREVMERADLAFERFRASATGAGR